MRIALCLVAGLWVVGCSHAGVVDDPRLAALDRVHPNGHIPTLEHHSAAAMDLDPDATPAATPTRASKTTLVARNESAIDDLGGGEIGAPPKGASAADAAFDSPSPKAKKTVKAKKAARRGNHHPRSQ